MGFQSQWITLSWTQYYIVVVIIIVVLLPQWAQYRSAPGQGCKEVLYSVVQLRNINISNPYNNNKRKYIESSPVHCSSRAERSRLGMDTRNTTSTCCCCWAVLLVLLPLLVVARRSVASGRNRYVKPHCSQCRCSSYTHIHTIIIHCCSGSSCSIYLQVVDILLHPCIVPSCYHQQHALAYPSMLLL